MKQAKRILIVVGVLIVGFLIFRPFVIVPAGERVVVFSLHGGVIPTQLNEGFHFIKPFIDHPEFYDARQQTYSISHTSWEGEVKGDDSIRCLTADGQEVSVELSVRFHIDPNNVW
ncbi:MAG: transporter, stomatin/podocin/band 7/nephrosis, partial [Chthonomonadales bacterium]|nr:transporter, stomatin/podocin/band 7/nephrosis [Chthonomonadales bacterium]